MEKWDKELEFLNYFPADNGDMFIVYELFTFDNMFRLLLKADYDHENALAFMMVHCSFSALVFQERIHNRRYRKLRAEDAVEPCVAACKAQLIHVMLECAKER